MKKFFAASILAASVLSFVAVSSLVPVAAMAQATNSGDIRGSSYPGCDGYRNQFEYGYHQSTPDQ
jgi:hypothetical protein